MKKRKVLIVIALFVLVALALGLVACKKPVTDDKQESQYAYEPKIDSSQYLVAENENLEVSKVLDFYKAKGFNVENIIAQPGLMLELFPNVDTKELVKSAYAIRTPGELDLDVVSGIAVITFKEETEAEIFANSFHIEDGTPIGKRIGATYYVCFDSDEDSFFVQNQPYMSYINPSDFDFFVIDNINDVLNGDEYTAQNHDYVREIIQPNIAKMPGGFVREMFVAMFDEDLGVEDKFLSEFIFVLEKWTGKQFPILRADARNTIKAFGDSVDYVCVYEDAAGTKQLTIEFNEKYDSKLKSVLVDEFWESGKGYISYIANIFGFFIDMLDKEYAYTDELSDAERTEVVARLQGIIEKEAAELDKYEGLGGNAFYMEEEMFVGDNCLSLKITNNLAKKEIKEVVGNNLRDKKVNKVFTDKNGFNQIFIEIDDFIEYATIKWGIEEFPDFGMEMIQACWYKYNQEAEEFPEKRIFFIKSVENNEGENKKSNFKNQKLATFFESKEDLDEYDSYFDKDLMWVVVGDKDLIGVYKSEKMPKEYKITFDKADCDEFDSFEEWWDKTTYNTFDRFEVPRPWVTVGENPEQPGSWFVKVGEEYEEIEKVDGHLYIDANFFAEKGFTDVTLYARPTE